MYGFAFPFIILFFVFLLRKIPKSADKYFIGVCFVIVYVFFSIAATKMIAFTFSISMVGFLALGAFVDSLLKIVILNKNFVNKKVYSQLFKLAIVVLILINGFNFEKIQKDHTMSLKDEDSVFYKKGKNHELISTLDLKLKTLYRPLDCQ